MPLVSHCKKDLVMNIFALFSEFFKTLLIRILRSNSRTVEYSMPHLKNFKALKNWIKVFNILKCFNNLEKFRAFGSVVEELEAWINILLYYFKNIVTKLIFWLYNTYNSKNCCIKNAKCINIVILHFSKYWPSPRM